MTGPEIAQYALMVKDINPNLSPSDIMKNLDNLRASVAERIQNGERIALNTQEQEFLQITENIEI